MVSNLEQSQAVLVQIAGRWGPRGENRLNNVGAGRDKRTMLTVVEVKKEIPVNKDRDQLKVNAMAIPLPADVIRLIDARNFAHLATIMLDGSPHSAPVWVGREGNHLIVCTDGGSVKARNTVRDPRVAISIFDLKDPYSEAQLRGRVVERRRDSDFKLLDGISRKYVGEPYPDHREPPVALVIEINKARYSKEPFEHPGS